MLYVLSTDLNGPIIKKPLFLSNLDIGTSRKFILSSKSIIENEKFYLLLFIFSINRELEMKPSNSSLTPIL